MSYPELRPGEKILQRWPANHRGDGERVMHGGRLELTTERLLFVPNSYGRLSDGKAWETDLADVRGASVFRKKSWWDVINRGATPFVVIDTRNGTRFLVNKPEPVAAAIMAAISTK